MKCYTPSYLHCCVSKVFWSVRQKSFLGIFGALAKTFVCKIQVLSSHIPVLSHLRASYKWCKTDREEQSEGERCWRDMSMRVDLTPVCRYVLNRAAESPWKKSFGLHGGNIFKTMQNSVQGVKRKPKEATYQAKMLFLTIQECRILIIFFTTLFWFFFFRLQNRVLSSHRVKG